MYVCGPKYWHISPLLSIYLWSDEITKYIDAANSGSPLGSAGRTPVLHFKGEWRSSYKELPVKQSMNSCSEKDQLAKR